MDCRCGEFRIDEAVDQVELGESSRWLDGNWFPGINLLSSGLMTPVPVLRILQACVSAILCVQSGDSFLLVTSKSHPPLVRQFHRGTRSEQPEAVVRQFKKEPRFAPFGTMLFSSCEDFDRDELRSTRPLKESRAVMISRLGWPDSGGKVRLDVVQFAVSVTPRSGKAILNDQGLIDRQPGSVTRSEQQSPGFRRKRKPACHSDHQRV